MPDVEIRPFSDQHLDAAAALLAERHERHLVAEPLLARDVDSVSYTHLTLPTILRV